MSKTVYHIHRNGQRWYVIAVKGAYLKLSSAVKKAEELNRGLKG